MGPDKAVAKELEAEVIELLPHATVKLRLANEDRVLAHMAGATKSNFVRLRPGDRVIVAVSPHDKTRGRIVKLLD
ncbi:translation initiation factor IF-1 [Bryobacterales bacterium F-183]|nr:translation initiation factor IF-1 [Bryobacterales bacterium F-183]